MPDIATLEEFASALQSDLDTATANLLLLDLAQGLVEERIGTQDPWPKTAKAVALRAAGRPYVNPDGAKRETVGGTTVEYNAWRMGVYLDADDKADLDEWLNDHGGGEVGSPRGAFPEALPWPDPADRGTLTDPSLL